MKVSANGIALIKKYEGFRSRPYQLGDGVTTIGYGETRGITMSSGPWTEAYASKRLVRRVNRDYAPWVTRLGLKFNQHQFDAIVSAVYNLGPGVLERGRSLGAALRSKRDAGYNRRVAAALRLYSMPGSKFHEGLLRRRNDEAALFSRPVLSAEERKRRRLTEELARLRAVVRTRFKGDWSKAPRRQRRADSIKAWLARHKR